MLSRLLLKGANVKALDKREKAPLHLAAFMGKIPPSLKYAPRV
jgi:hypothetical protein